MRTGDKPRPTHSKAWQHVPLSAGQPHLSRELYGEPAREGSGSSAAPSVISNMVRSVSCRERNVSAVLEKANVDTGLCEGKILNRLLAQLSLMQVLTTGPRQPTPSKLQNSTPPIAPHLHVVVKRLPVPVAEKAEGHALAYQTALQVLLRLAPLRQQAAPVGQRRRLAVRVPALRGSKGQVGCACWPCRHYVKLQEPQLQAGFHTLVIQRRTLPPQLDRRTWMKRTMAVRRTRRS